MQHGRDSMLRLTIAELGDDMVNLEIVLVQKKDLVIVSYALHY
jgi:hypothetical protein